MPRQLLDTLRRVAGDVPVVDMDVVEVSPPYDTSDVTAFLANRDVLEMLSGIAHRRRGGTWGDIPATQLEGRT
jgi:agmatinase